MTKEEGGRLMRVVKTLCCAAALTALLAPGARADQFDKKTILTFSGPVQIPGATLAAGTYVFKLADLQSNRHVVQVFDKDEKKVYGTILAIPDEKLDPSDKPVVMFAERPAGTPQAVKAWVYPGETIGNEFGYPKSQAMKSARATHQSVLSMDEAPATTTDAQRRDAMKSAQVSRVDETGAAKPETTTAPAPQTSTAGSPAPTTAPATTTEAANRPATTTTASRDARLKNSSGNASQQTPRTTTARPAPVGTSGQAEPRRSLPRTASNLTLIELFGLAAIAGALGLRRLRTIVETAK